ncbi:MAG: HDOD domain-containing protein [Nitrospiraceae bacterium]|jgi:putative nucleotidyltransferase with HDIG domain|nr:HDOD domain-containing protein [Nitrospiraceae bacterium]
MNDADLEKIILQTGDIPSLPAVAAKVLQMISSENLSLNDLEKTIENDQAFSSRVLKIANSSFYGRNRTVDSISTALMLIGFKTMSSLVIATAMKDVNRRFGLFEQKLWDHSLAVSLAASMLARETRLVPADEAHVAGLIHDVGKTVLNNNIPDQYVMIVENVYAGGGSFLEVEDAMLGYNHCNVGGFIARKWKLPKNLEVVIEFHHHTESSRDIDPTLEPLCQLVAVADSMANSLGMGLSGERVIGDRLFEVVGLGEKRYAELLEEFRKVFEEQKQSLSAT